MTKNLRRILAVALVFTMLACSFAGCKKSNNKKKSNSSTASTSSVDSSSGADSTSDDDTADNSDIPIDNIDDPVPDPGYDNNEPIDPNAPLVPDDPDLPGIDDPDIYEPDVDDIDFDDSYVSPIKVYGSAVKKGSTIRNIDVKTDKVVHKDWLSTGGNIFPGLMSETGMEFTGMNWSLFEIERKRFTSAKPRLNRMFLPVDYMITNESTSANPNKDQKNWENGIYDFNSDRMKAVYEYVEMVENYGGDILLDYGWKVDKRLESWFSLSDTNPSGSAPADLKSFSKACAAAVKQLKVVKGYNNIKYLSFFNEMGHTGHDFDTLGDRKVYYLSMLKMIKSDLQKEGLFDNIKIWVAEDGVYSGTAQYFQKNWDSNLSGYCFHHYPHDNSSGEGFYTYMHSVGELLKGTFKKPVYITEYATGVYDEILNGYLKNDDIKAGYRPWNWEDTTASFYIACANSGISGGSRWGYSTDFFTSINVVGFQNSDFRNHWDKTTSVDSINNGLKFSYYQEALLTNYVPQHSGVLQTDWQGDDIRVSSFRLPDGNITVVVEVKEGTTEKTLNLNFDKNLNKTIYRMSFDFSVSRNGNATVPPCDKVFANAENTVSDTVNKDYGMYVYTTMKPIKQIELNSVAVKAAKGDTVNFAASLVDCSTADEVEWSICAATNNAAKGTIDQNGVYRVSDNAKSGDTVAVRAQLKSDGKIFNSAVIVVE